MQIIYGEKFLSCENFWIFGNVASKIVPQHVVALVAHTDNYSHKHLPVSNRCDLEGTQECLLLYRWHVRALWNICQTWVNCLNGCGSTQFRGGLSEAAELPEFHHQIKANGTSIPEDKENAVREI